MSYFLSFLSSRNYAISKPQAFHQLHFAHAALDMKPVQGIAHSNTLEAIA